MIADLGNAIRAELVKLRGLPVVLATMLRTVAAGSGLSVALAATSVEPKSGVSVMVGTIPFLQVGPILLGVLAVGTEYQGGQIRSTLTATPARLRLLSAKLVATLAVVTVTSAVTVGAEVAAAQKTLAARHLATTPLDGRAAVGAGCYLVLIGMLGFSVTVLLRSLIPALVSMLGVVLMVSPLVSLYTEHARWLPDRAGSLLYLPATDALLTATTGTLVRVAWIAAIGAAGVVSFVRRDA